MAAVTNLSAYKFAPLSGLPELRDRLRAFTQAQGLKGTILLSTEGINLFVAGTASATDALIAELGVAQHILRYWETKFPQLKPLQRAWRGCSRNRPSRRLGA